MSSVYKIAVAILICHLITVQAQRGRSPCDGVNCGRGSCLAVGARAICTCSTGFKFDSRSTSCVAERTGACPRCGANQCASSSPAGQTISYRCPNGFEMDRCGCTTSCLCSDCPNFNSALQCEHGFRVDTIGCPLDECVIPACPTCRSQCGVFARGQTAYTCPNGFITNSCGCPTDSCQCKGCPRLNTNLQCDVGFKIDSRGCPMNECLVAITSAPVRTRPGPTRPAPTRPAPTRPAPTTTVRVPTNTRCRPCPPSRCGRFSTNQTPYTCPRGFVRDSCGCELSTCQCAGCPALDTSMVCPYGYRTSLRCPKNICHKRPPPAISRCPTRTEPAGRAGPFCSFDHECPGELICCPTFFRSRRACLTAILLEGPYGK